MMPTLTARNRAIPVLLTRNRVVPMLLAGSGWLLLGLSVLGALGPVRPALMFAFALTCPGYAIVRLVPLPDPLERAVVTLAMSLSAATLAAEAVYIAHVLRPDLVLAALAAVCTAAAMPGLLRGAKPPW